MGNSTYKSALLLLFGTLCLLTTACSEAIFSNDSRQGLNALDGEGGETGDLIFIDDSFERDDIFGNLEQEIIYGWRGFIQDGLNNIFGFLAPSGAGMRIPPAGEVGLAFDGTRFLVMHGDNDTGVESMYLVSPSYDLTGYNTVILSFRYITFNLNDVGDVVNENLELQVCRGTLNECGANDDALNANGLISNNWITVFTNDANVNDDNFNSLNHAVTDWQPAVAVIDLRNPELVGDRSTFVFRFRTSMNSNLVLANAEQDSEENESERIYLDEVKREDRAAIHAKYACEEEAEQLLSLSGSNHKHDRRCGHDDRDEKKVLICHVPPGNPDARHEICIGESGIRGHKSHGSGYSVSHYSEKRERDYYGPCDGDNNQNGNIDGLGIDDVLGRATPLNIEDIF